MALAYLLDPSIQHQNLAGVNNVNGYFEVFYNQTDDHATVYTDFDGTLAPEHIVIDNAGRCVMVVDSSRVYRVEMYAPNGALIYSQYPVWCFGAGEGGSSSTEIISTDGSIDVEKTQIGSTTQYDLSVAEDDVEGLLWAKCSSYRTAFPGVFSPVGDEGSTLFSDQEGLILPKDGYYHVTARVKVEKSTALPFYDSVRTDIIVSDTTQVSLDAVVDFSLGLSQEFEVSGDVKVGSEDSRIYVKVYPTLDATYSLVGLDCHKVYSGIPRNPPRYVAGRGISIQNNVISADVFSINTIQVSNI